MLTIYIYIMHYFVGGGDNPSLSKLYWSPCILMHTMNYGGAFNVDHSEVTFKAISMYWF